MYCICRKYICIMCIYKSIYIITSVETHAERWVPFDATRVILRFGYMLNVSLDWRPLGQNITDTGNEIELIPI